MGQDRKRGAGKQKHNQSERRVWIFQRQACSFVHFGAFDGTGGFLILQLCDFSVVLNRIVHLPVPSENLSRRGKEDFRISINKANGRENGFILDEVTLLLVHIDQIPGFGRRKRFDLLKSQA
jgi:hypothetical protein